VLVGTGPANAGAFLPGPRGRVPSAGGFGAGVEIGGWGRAVIAGMVCASGRGGGEGGMAAPAAVERGGTVAGRRVCRSWSPRSFPV